MTVSTLHTLYAVNTPSGLISQITDYNHDFGIQQILESGDGKVDPEFAATITQQPVLGFTTTKIATALGIAGFSGLNVTGELAFFFRKMEKGGTRATGSNHIKLSSSLGLLLPRTLQASQGQVANLSYEMLPVSSDGDSATFSVATGQSLAGTPDETEKYTVGPAKVNGALIGGITDLTIDFGLQQILEGADGAPFATFYGIQTRQPEIRLTTNQQPNLESLSITENGSTHYGQETISSSTQVSLWKVKNQGIRDAQNGVVITIPEGRVTVDTTSATNPDPSTIDLVITPTDDGVNSPIQIAAASTIPS